MYHPRPATTCLVDARLLSPPPGSCRTSWHGTALGETWVHRASATVGLPGLPPAWPSRGQWAFHWVPSGVTAGSSRCDVTEFCKFIAQLRTSAYAALPSLRGLERGDSSSDLVAPLSVRFHFWLTQSCLFEAQARHGSHDCSWRESVSVRHDPKHRAILAHWDSGNSDAKGFGHWTLHMGLERELRIWFVSAMPE